MKRIGGEWRGHYSYRGYPELGDGFAAFFTESEGELEGKIIDDNGPGPANVSGAFSFPSLQFTKRYGHAGPVRETERIGDTIITSYLVFDAPVEYEGSMSTDGKTLRGTWTIADGGAGSWTAHRVEEEDISKKQQSQEQIKQPDLVDQDQ